MFVSPVSRYSIVFGKILGETLVAVMQVVPMVVFAAILRVPLTATALALLVPVALLSCFMGGSFGLLLLNTMSDSRASNQIFNFVFLPQYFLAGLISPINNLPWYLEVLSLASPMRYVIDLARGVVFAGSRDYARVVLLNPVTNVAVLALMLGVFLIVGTTLFVRRETNR
jgi:ABC-2 type transport system permease protein